MRQLSIMLILVAPVWAQNPVPQGQEQTPSSRASIRTDFRVQYVNGNNAYLSPYNMHKPYIR